MYPKGLRLLLVFTIIALINIKISGQTAIPGVLDKGTLMDQMNYLEEKTRIYENYRAIREDMFQKIKKNAVDSLTTAKSRITGLIGLTGSLNSRIDSLNRSLDVTKEELKEVTRTKNSINLIGINLNKIAYNTIMWTIAGVLAFLLAVGFLAFKHNLTVSHNLKKGFNELKTEFEEYRQKSRLEREKMSMDHFNENKKLREKR